MTAYQNKEYILKTNESYFRPDFCLVEAKKIIEFDGDYWHSEKIANPERERIRDEQMAAAGFQVLRVKEHEWNNNKEEVIAKCIKFLKQ